MSFWRGSGEGGRDGMDYTVENAISKFLDQAKQSSIFMITDGLVIYWKGGDPDEQKT